MGRGIQSAKAIVPDLWRRSRRSRITLYRNDEAIDEGVGANVLDGPIQALTHLVDVLERDPHNPPIRAGEIVTTGTLTRAFPVKLGERWSTRIEGVDMARTGGRDPVVAWSVPGSARGDLQDPERSPA